jgi:hypothetical protein
LAGTVRAFLSDLVTARLPLYVTVRQEEGSIHLYIQGYCVAVVVTR